jgi:hypothetical protein
MHYIELALRSVEPFGGFGVVHRCMCALTTIHGCSSREALEEAVHTGEHNKGADKIGV